MSNRAFLFPGRRAAPFLLCCGLALASPLGATDSPQDGNFDRSFNTVPSWNGAPGWATIPFDDPGRTPRDTALGVRLLLDGTMIIGGLAGRDRLDDNNGLLAAVRLNSDGTPSSFWASPEDLRGGTQPGRITWPYMYDFFTMTPAGMNPGGNEGVGFAGSGRVTIGTNINRAKYFSVSPSGTTLNGGLGTCELYAGGALRNFYALGASTRYYDAAVIAGYVQRYGDQAYLEANCELTRNQVRTRTVPDTLPGTPAGVIGAVSVMPHYVTADATVYSRRLFRNFNSAADNDVELCEPGYNYTVTPPTPYTNCSVFQPNIGGHLDDLLFSVVPSYGGFTTGLIESQAESSPGAGDDRRVLTIARPRVYGVNATGSVYERESQLRTYQLGDATSPASSLSFHSPIGVFDGRNGTTLWVVMAVRPFPGGNEFREIAVARFKYYDLSLDTRFGNGTGWRRYSLGGAEVMPNAVVLDNQGRLVIAGTRRYNPDTDDWDFFVMRINDDVLFEDEFGD